VSEDQPDLHPFAATAAPDTVGWQLSGLARPDAELLEELRMIAEVAAERHTAPRFSPGLVRVLHAITRAAATLAAAKSAIGLAMIAVARQPIAGAATSLWLPLLDAVFGGTGLVLVIGGSKDHRVRSLGVLFLTIAAAFADPLVRVGATGALGRWGHGLSAVPPEAFFAFALWRFVWVFPDDPLRTRGHLLASRFLTTAAVIGVGLCAANALLALSPAAFADGRALAWVAVFDRRVASGAFWPVLLGSAIPAIPYLIWKSHFEVIENKRRVAWFVLGIAAGITPIIVTVIAAPLVPALRDPANRDAIGVVIYGALIAVIPITVYAVGVRRVMDVQFVLHRTIQRTLAQYAVWSASIVPLVYLLAQMYLHRDLRVTDLVSQSVAWLTVPLLGLLALTFREQLLAHVDRWFFRERVDSIEAVARLDRALRSARDIVEVAGVLTQEVDRLFTPRTVTLLLANEDGSEYQSVSRRMRPLSARSTVIELVRSTRTVLHLDLRVPGPVLRLLPVSDRRWLEQAGFELIAPLFGSEGALLALLALSDSRSELPYTKSDRATIAAMTSYAAMRIEYYCSKGGPASLDGSLLPPLHAIDVANQPAVCCSRCGAILTPAHESCACGGPTRPTALPSVVNGKFRMEQLIGAGGMGVVYLAVDLALDRRVAIKTLPALTPERARRLQREARTMACVLHPNLASIFSFEAWRDTPFVVVEYLEGGTLADRLKQGPLTIAAVVNLGIVLADVLDRLHGSGILHRDVKPSNIGYTREGEPKLLDFGLAGLFDPEGDVVATLTLAGDDPPPMTFDSAALTLTLKVVGTPLYLPPEAMRGAAPGPAFDVWSLAVVLYEAIAGTLPYAGLSGDEVLSRLADLVMPDVRESTPTCPANLAEFLRKALSPDSSRRWATAAEFRQQLQRIRDDFRSVHQPI
jgi:hypothetical protein